MRPLRLAALALVAASLAPVTGRAQTFNGGMPSLWNCTGYCGTSTANGSIGLAPNAGSQYGFVSTAGSTATGIGLPGVGGTGVATNGSVLRTGIFNAGSGDVLSFWFNYVTRDGAGYADYAWSRILDGNGTELALLFTARTTTSGSVVPGADMPAPQATLTPGVITTSGTAPTWAPLGADESGNLATNCWDAGCGFTGWVNSQFTFATTGTYMLEFGVVNWDPTGGDDRWLQSGLAFDGVMVNNTGLVVTSAGTAATSQNMAASAPNGSGQLVTPEPAPLLLVGTGVLALAVAQRRRRSA